jgi:kynurenine formamidase
MLATLSASNASTTPPPAKGASMPGRAPAQFHKGENYYNCGTGQAGLHQPGFSLGAVRWLIDRQVLGHQGAPGTDTFGPDDQFRASSLVLHRHRLTLENLTGLGQLPANGAWVVVGGPRNREGSGSPAAIYGLVH